MRWIISPRFPDYEISEYGDVRRCRRGIRGGFPGKIMKPYRRADGYNMFILRRDSEVYEIRELYRDGKALQRELAARFGIKQGHVSRIVNGVRWAHAS